MDGNTDAEIAPRVHWNARCAAHSESEPMIFTSSQPVQAVAQNLIIGAQLLC
jgi:hypothetical protein